MFKGLIVNQELAKQKAFLETKFHTSLKQIILPVVFKLKVFEAIPS